MKTLCKVKEARHKRPRIVYFHLYETSRNGKFIVIGYSLVVDGILGGGESRMTA